MNARSVPPLGWPADVQLEMPGSKSVANRLLIAAATAGVPMTLRGVTASDDVAWMLAGLRTLGFGVAFDTAQERVTFTPRPFSPGSGTLFCGNAGTALRFLVSLAAITPGDWTVTGDAAMQRRPIGPLVDAWRQLGVEITANDGCPPVRIRGNANLTGGGVRLDASASSQFVSSLLLVGHRLPHGLEVQFRGNVASIEYAQLTCRILRCIGAAAEVTPAGARVLPGCKPENADIAIEGDWSSMGVWTCLQHLTGSHIAAGNLALDSTQADEQLAVALTAQPAAGDATIDVAPFPDQFLNLVAVAAFRRGTTHFVGGQNLRIKECDRIAVAARELRRLGGDCDERPDGLVVRGGRTLHGGTIDPERDHRVAMAFALVGLLVPGIAIADPDCVTKSYPAFWRDVARVLAHRRPLAIIGMRGAGKTTLAKALASATGTACIDTDERFVAAHGPIAAFVAKNGWPAFRALEEQLLATALLPGAIVSTGGGAIESDATRRLLHEHAYVLWLDAATPVLRDRLLADAADRPSLTGASPIAELELVQQRRRPLYAAVAHRQLDAALPIATLLASALAWPFTAAT
jgi:3-phosphoshikimate 1-carboxyvinyltransferase